MQNFESKLFPDSQPIWKIFLRVSYVENQTLLLIMFICSIKSIPMLQALHTLEQKIYYSKFPKD